MRTSSYVLRVVQRDGVVVELRDADPRWSVLELMSHVTTAAPRTRWARDEDDQRAPQLALVAAGDGLRRASSLADLGCPTTLHIVGSVADAADVVPDPIAYSARVCRTVISATDRAALAIWRAFLLRNSSFERCASTRAWRLGSTRLTQLGVQWRCGHSHAGIGGYTRLRRLHVRVR